MMQQKPTSDARVIGLALDSQIQSEVLKATREERLHKICKVEYQVFKEALEGAQVTKIEALRELVERAKDQHLDDPTLLQMEREIKARHLAEQFSNVGLIILKHLAADLKQDQKAFEQAKDPIKETKKLQPLRGQTKPKNEPSKGALQKCVCNSVCRRCSCVEEGCQKKAVLYCAYCSGGGKKGRSRACSPSSPLSPRSAADPEASAAEMLYRDICKIAMDRLADKEPFEKKVQFCEWHFREEAHRNHITQVTKFVGKE